MSERPQPDGGRPRPAPLSDDELREVDGVQLPERAAMSLVNANVAIPINAAVAANVLSDHANAVADPAQTGAVAQNNA